MGVKKNTFLMIQRLSIIVMANEHYPIVRFEIEIQQLIKLLNSIIYSFKIIKWYMYERNFIVH